MGKKTNKGIYVILGILAMLSAALAVFAVFRRKQLLEEGDLELAAFSVTMGLIGIVFCLVSCIIIFLLLKKDKRVKTRQQLFEQELSRTPAFARWLSNEEKQLKNKLCGPRIFIGTLSILMIWGMLLMLYLILDRTEGALGVFQYIAFLFCLFVFCFLWWISDYHKQYMKSLLQSVSEQLSSDTEKDAFGEQLSKTMGASCQFSYLADPQFGASTAWVTEDYTYFRQFRQCRILKNRNIDKAVLKKAPFMIGFRPHFRICYTLEIFVRGEEKRVWCGYFRQQGDLHHALNVFKDNGLADTKVENYVL